MPTKKLSRLKEITDLREIWPNEATDFTPWLAEDENIELLADTIGIEIVVEDTEVSVGSFNADIYAKEADTGKRIVIENQLEPTDHDHLGKIITYAAGKDASYVIWVVKQARPEHKAAIEWLNAHTDSDVGFFLCEIKLYQIGTSDIAPQFVAVEAPNDWSKIAKATTNNSNSGASPATRQQRYEYWTAFNDYCNDNGLFTNGTKAYKASEDHWHPVYHVPRKNIDININRQQLRKSIEVSFDIYDDKALYDDLLEHKEEIEAAVGSKLTWNAKDNRKASRIQLEKEFSIENEEDWPQQFEWAMQITQKLIAATKPFIH